MTNSGTTSSLSWISRPLTGSLFKNKSVLGQIAVDMVFAAVVAFVFYITRGPKKLLDIDPSSSREFVVSVLALILWYITTVVDIFVREARISTPYNYFCIDVGKLAFKFCAEGLLVITTYRIVTLHLLQQTRKAMLGLLLGEICTLALLITALYSLGSLIAWQLMWLRLADNDTQAQFALPQRKFEAAFYAIQFCMGFFATVFAGINAWMFYRVGGAPTASIHRLFWGTTSLWIWCTSELAFGVNSHLGDRPPAKNTNLARDTVYGLFTLSCLFLFAFDGKATKNNGNGNAKASLPAHLHAHLLDTKAGCRGYILEQLGNRAVENEKPPPFADFIRDLRRTPASQFHGNTRDGGGRLDAQSQRSIEEKYREYVTELEGRYGELEYSQVIREL